MVTKPAFSAPLTVIWLLPFLLVVFLLSTMMSVSAEGVHLSTLEPAVDHRQTVTIGVLGDASKLKINEFMASNRTSVPDPDAIGPTPEYDDWIEIYNPTSADIDMKGLYLTDSISPTEKTKHIISETIIIPAKGFVLFWADESLVQGPFHLAFKLKQSGETLAIIDSDGETVIDQVQYGAQMTDVSEGRLPDGGETWTTFPAGPTPGRTNVLSPNIRQVKHEPASPSADQPVTVTAVISDDVAVERAFLYYGVAGERFFKVQMQSTGGTAFNSLLPIQPQNDLVVNYYVEAIDDDDNISLLPRNAPTETFKYVVGYEAPLLYLNEFMADNGQVFEDLDEPGEYPDWFEIYNPGPTAVSLDGLTLTDDLDKPTRFAIADGIRIPPRGFIVFFADNDSEQGPLHTNFGLNDGGEAIGIFGAFGTVPIDTIVYEKQLRDTPYGRFPDGTGAWGSVLCSSIGAKNVLCDQQTYLPVIALE